MKNKQLRCLLQNIVGGLSAAGWSAATFLAALLTMAGLTDMEESHHEDLNNTCILS